MDSKDIEKHYTNEFMAMQAQYGEKGWVRIPASLIVTMGSADWDEFIRQFRERVIAKGLQFRIEDTLYDSILIEWRPDPNATAK